MQPIKIIYIYICGLQVEKLKNLCLKQREEIKALKSATLFPDHATDSHLQGLLEKQGSELKQVIPSLQRQVTSLTGHLQSLAQDLAEVFYLSSILILYMMNDNSSFIYSKLSIRRPFNFAG